MINRTAIITSYCPNINAYQSGTCTSVFVAGFGNVYVHGHLQEFFQRGGGVTACIDRNRPWILRLGMTLAAAKDVTHVHVFHLLYGLSSSATLATANTTTGSWYGTSYGDTCPSILMERAKFFWISLTHFKITFDSSAEGTSEMSRYLQGHSTKRHHFQIHWRRGEQLLS